VDLQEVDKLLTQTLSWCNGAKSELFGDGSVASKRDKCIKAICKAEDKIITARDIIRGRSGEFITESFEKMYQQSLKESVRLRTQSGKIYNDEFDNPEIDEIIDTLEITSTPRQIKRGTLQFTYDGRDYRITHRQQWTGGGPHEPFPGEDVPLTWDFRRASNNPEKQGEQSDRWNGGRIGLIYDATQEEALKCAISFLESRK